MDAGLRVVSPEGEVDGRAISAGAGRSGTEFQQRVRTVDSGSDGGQGDVGADVARGKVLHLCLSRGCDIESGMLSIPQEYSYLHEVQEVINKQQIPAVSGDLLV